MAPTIRMMIDRTEAKIGRSMKKWEKRMERLRADRPTAECARRAASLATALISPFCGTTLAPGRTIGLARPSITTLSVGCQALAHDAQALDQRAQGHGLGLDDVVLADREHDLARLVGDDRGVGDQQRVVLAAEQLQAAEDAGRQELVLVLDDGAAAHACRSARSSGCRRSRPCRCASIRSRRRGGCAPGFAESREDAMRA